MRIGATLLLSVAMLLALGCIPINLPPPPLGIDRLDAPPQNSSQVDEATAKLFAPVKGKAVVYVYRPMKFTTRRMNNSIVINDKFIAFLENGSFLRMVIPGGKCAIRVGGANYTFKEHEIDVEAGQVYFFASPVNRDLAPVVFPVKPNEAKSEILKFKLIDNPYNF